MGVLPRLVTVVMVLGSLGVVAVNALTISAQKVGGNNLQEFVDLDGGLV
jgi:hypothetical protein